MEGAWTQHHIPHHTTCLLTRHMGSIPSSAERVWCRCATGRSVDNITHNTCPSPGTLAVSLSSWKSVVRVCGWKERGQEEMAVARPSSSRYHTCSTPDPLSSSPKVEQPDRSQLISVFLSSFSVDAIETLKRKSSSKAVHKLYPHGSLSKDQPWWVF